MAPGPHLLLARGPPKARLLQPLAQTPAPWQISLRHPTLRPSIREYKPSRFPLLGVHLLASCSGAKRYALLVPLVAAERHLSLAASELRRNLQACSVSKPGRAIHHGSIFS